MSQYTGLALEDLYQVRIPVPQSVATHIKMEVKHAMMEMQSQEMDAQIYACKKLVILALGLGQEAVLQYVEIQNELDQNNVTMVT